ncbi:MAG: hypothetical protein KAT16_06765 [Candidatus Heimdallarchaeota archaeon]|nr:hypothetical protein [Candidatus Heimdallarchaeota archaeon]
MASSQTTAHFFRVIYIILFVFSGLLVVVNIDSAMFDFTKLLEFLDYLTLLVQEGVRMMGGVAYSITLAILSVKSKIPFIGDEAFAAINHADIVTMLSSILDPLNSFYPHSTITIDPLNIITDFSTFFGATAILILIPIAFLSGIGFLREGDTKLAIYSFLGFQLILIIAIFTQHILITMEIKTNTLLSMITSPIFTLGFLLYLLLEVAFQTSYTLNIIEPMTEREKRIQEHLKRIRTFVPTSEEGESSTDHSVQSVQSKKFGLLAASYLREMVERRVFRRGETVRDAKTMMRLQSYLSNLTQSDPRAEAKLAAQTAQPDVSSLLKYFVPAMLFRVVAVILLSYFIMSPEGILNFFMGASFPALLHSLELSQPEFQTIALFNIALLFILIGAILNYFSSEKTGKVLKRVVQQIDTLVDFDRSSPQTAAEESSEEAPITEEEQMQDEEEEI